MNLFFIGIFAFSFVDEFPNIRMKKYFIDSWFGKDIFYLVAENLIISQ